MIALLPRRTPRGALFTGNPPLQSRTMTAPTTPTLPGTAFPCQRCGMVLFAGNLVCPNCGALVHAQRLTDLAIEAQREEQTNALRAAMIWREALPLLPPDSRQYQTIVQRIGMLTSNLAPTPSTRTPMTPTPTPPPTPGWSAIPIPSAPPPAAARSAPRNDPLPLAIAKTGGSMLISIVIYAWLFGQQRGLDFGIKFATGFVVLMLVHELGHSLAMRYFRLSASPPIFIPFLGAAVNMRELPRDALEEAVVALAGPVAGAIATGVAYFLYLQTGSLLMLRVAEFSFLLNLLNMLPIPPLDGGRVTAALGPWVWIVGLFGLALYMGYDWFARGRFNFILVLLVLFAWPRIAATLAARRAGAGGGAGTTAAKYFDIGRGPKWAIGIAYLVLSALLAAMYFLCRWESSHRFGSGWIG